MVKAPIGGVNHHNHHQGAKQSQARALQKSRQYLSIAPHETPFTGILMVPATAADTAHDRQEYQRHGKRGNQADQHGHRQVLHELAHHTGPEQQRYEHRERRGGRGNDRPGHARGRFHPGGLNRLTVRQVPICQLRNHNGTVHQHACYKDQAEQHHNVERQAHTPDHQNAGQKRPGDGEPHQHRRAGPHGRDHHDDHQHNGGQHVVEQIREDIAHFLGLVHDEADIEGLRQPGPGLINQGANLLNGFNNVGARALGNFQYQGGLPVDAGEAGRVFEGALQHGHITEGNHSVAVYLNRHRHHIFDGFDYSRHFQRHPTITRVE